MSIQQQTFERMREICRQIAADMETDATRFDGQPFNGRTVAEYLGNLGAAVAGLARIVESLSARIDGDTK